MKATTTEPPIPTTTEKAHEASNVQNWGNVNWFEATTTTKPMHHKWNPWNSDKKKLLDDQDLDNDSKTHHSYNHKTSKTDSDNYWHNTQDATKTKSGTEYGTYDHTQNDEFPTHEAMTTATDEEFPRRVFVDNNPDFPEEPKSRLDKPAENPTEAAVPTTISANLETTEGELLGPTCQNLFFKSLYYL